MTENTNRTNFNTAVDIAKTDGFELLWNNKEYNDKFVSVKTPIPAICIRCKTDTFKSLFNMKRGSKCKICGSPRKTKLLKYKTVNEEFIKNGMTLLWNEKEFNENFTGCTQKIPVICVCNEKQELCYSSVRQGKKCQDCANNRKKTYEEVLLIVESKGMKLIYTKTEFDEIYKSMNSPIKILCKCDKEYIVRINDVKFGYSCKDCGKDKIKKTNMERYGVENVSQSV